MTRELVFNKFPVDLISKKNFLDMISDWVSRPKKKKVFYTNVHTIYETSKNPKLLKSFVDADLVYPDGFGPLIALNKIRKRERINAADLVDQLYAKLNKLKVKIYLLGDFDEVLQKTNYLILKKYKKIKVVGYHSGYFNVLENNKIIKEIKSLKPHLVLIGMGTPKQEVWVNDNWNKLPKAVYWCVGGLFNYLAKSRKRAPVWMRENSMEWLYRFLQDPRRLYYRYTAENLFFLFLFLKFWFRKLFKLI